MFSSASKIIERTQHPYAILSVKMAFDLKFSPDNFLSD